MRSWVALSGLTSFLRVSSQGVALGCDRPRLWRYDQVGQGVQDLESKGRVHGVHDLWSPKGTRYRSPGQRPGFAARTTRSPEGAA
jgi:hypothetical protein